MLQHFKILTITHRQTQLSSLERYVIPASDNGALVQQLAEIKRASGLEEFMYLATCNRILYLFTTEAELTPAYIESFFARVQPTSAVTADEVVALSGTDAVSHLLDVAASVDSLVVGERQILGQLREAYNNCHAWGFTGDDLRMLMQTAVAAAKTVYARTRIGEKPVSVASLAVQQMLRKHIDREARIVLVGAGQTNTLVAKFLQKHHYTNVTVFNRTLGRAERLAERFAGKALPLSELPHFSEGFDCLIACTAAGRAIIDRVMLTTLLRGEAMTDKLIIDLAIPQNIDPAVVAAFPASYIGMDGLRQLAQENLAFREREVDKARLLLDEQLAAFPRLYQERKIERALRQLPEQVRAVRERAINEVFSKEVADLDDDARALMERMLVYMEKKCIGIPMRVAREAFIE